MNSILCIDMHLFLQNFVDAARLSSHATNVWWTASSLLIPRYDEPFIQGFQAFSSLLCHVVHLFRDFNVLQEGLVMSNMHKLTFFAMKSPEKLDRIGDYLAQRLSRDVSRQKYR